MATLSHRMVYSIDQLYSLTAIKHHLLVLNWVRDHLLDKSRSTEQLGYVDDPDVNDLKPHTKKSLFIAYFDPSPQ